MVDLLYDVRAHLGEGPVWDTRTQTLYWLDILSRCIFANDDLLVQVDETVGCLAPHRDGGLIFTKKASFWTLDPATARTSLLHPVADEPVGNRFNDGKCDPRGRFLAGSLDLNETDPTGSLYSLSGGVITKLLDGVTISNGLTWSPNYKTLYYIDTPTREIRAYDYDLENGAIANPRVAVHVPESLGWPDGMTSDQRGHLWVGMWGGAQLTRWDPHSGQLLEQIPVPAKNVSSCIFGGPDLDQLYITTARKGLDKAILADYPLTGGVFRLQTQVEGMPVFSFAG